MYHRLSQDVPVPGVIDGDLRLGEDGAQHRPQPLLAAGHGDLPPAGALLHQTQDLPRHQTALLLRISGTEPAHAVIFPGEGLSAPCKELPPQESQRGRLSLLAEGLHLLLRPQAQQGRRRLPGSLKLLPRAVEAVRRQADRHLRPAVEHLGDDLLLDAVEVCKAVKIKVLSIGEVPLLQGRQQAVEAGLRISAAVGAGSLIALHQQGKFLQLLGQDPGQGRRRFPQGGGGHAEAAEFIKGIQELQ